MLAAIFYSEFHHILGPKCLYEVPDGFVRSAGSSSDSLPTQTLPYTSKSDPQSLDFDSISEYIIPKPNLCNRLVTITASGYKVVGFPVSITDSKYERNALLFNLCFVFEKESNTSSGEQVVRKMARVLRSLEIEGEFLSNPSTKGNVLNIMEQLLQDLNTYFECKIPINDADTINLKLFPRPSDPDPVYHWQVPVALIQLGRVVDKYWDMSMRRIIPFINGVLSMKHIAELADVEFELVRMSIKHLMYYGVVKMVDIFQFSNVYACKSSIYDFLQSQDLQSECLQFIKRPGIEKLPSFMKIFKLYCCLKHGQSLQQWIEEHDIWSYPIDIRRMIIFGVVKGFLYRVHKYPIWRPHVDGPDINSPIMALRDEVKRFSHLLDGQHHYDEICSEFNMPAHELDAVLMLQPSIFFLFK